MIEHFFDALPSFITHFKVLYASSFRETLSIKFVHLPTIICQVCFSATEHKRVVNWRILTQVTDPVLARLEGFVVCDVEAEDGRLYVTVVHAGDLAETFLASGVPED